jgi:DNA-binding NtrC family response regulator
LIEGGELRVSDLDSHNGTLVNGQRLDGGRALSTGDVVTVGEVVLVVHARARRTAGCEALDERSWRRRLDDEVARAVEYKRPLAVMSIHGGTQTQLVRLLRTIDVLGTFSDGEVMVCLPEADRAAAGRMAAVVSGALGPASRVGVATSPFDATDADSLVLAARAGARLAQPGGVGAGGDAFERLALGDREVLLAHPAMVRVYELLKRLASADLSVLIIGETGTGKENAAFAVHHYSPRASKPFIAVNCAALPETLVESTLFGYDKGAFTGATVAKAGLLETIDGGTLFLDEVGELALSVQAKLLRALETRKITRLGEHKERPIDVRLVTATHRVLEKDVEEGRFRRDLYFRIGAARVFVPPLRDRRCEIPLLFRELLARAAERAGRSAPDPTPATMRALLAHGWPGNVRELKHVAEYVAATVVDERVEPTDLPGELAALGAEPVSAPLPAALVEPGTRTLAEELEEIERTRIAQALAASGGVKTRAAQTLGMPIRTFTMKVKQYGLG